MDIKSLFGLLWVPEIMELISINLKEKLNTTKPIINTGLGF